MSLLEFRASFCLHISHSHLTLHVALVIVMSDSKAGTQHTSDALPGGLQQSNAPGGGVKTTQAKVDSNPLGGRESNTPSGDASSTTPGGTQQTPGEPLGSLVVRAESSLVGTKKVTAANPTDSEAPNERSASSQAKASSHTEQPSSPRSSVGEVSCPSSPVRQESAPNSTQALGPSATNPSTSSESTPQVEQIQYTVSHTQPAQLRGWLFSQPAARSRLRRFATVMQAQVLR
jgi:hypothetical protein